MSTLIHSLIEQTTGDCHSDHDALFNMAYALAEKLQFPLNAMWLGDHVTVVAIDPENSSSCQGIKAVLAEEAKPIPLLELTFVQPDSTSATWLTAYQQWLIQEGIVFV